ncbi:MAG: hypothetical protein EOM24_05360 [Chloroflexia bacterium]|nr:hypothetical protein [Chloroflexia bacterium]
MTKAPFALTPYPSHSRFVHVIRAAAADWFAERKLPTHPRYNHVLSKDVPWHANLILPEVRAYIHAEIANADPKVARRRPFALNGAIHNGASSQAMAFNLIGPLITRNDLEPLQVVIEAADIPWPWQARAAFEVENRTIFNEQGGQPTSVDLVINGGPADHGPIMIEVKLVESGFGGCGTLASGKCDTSGANPRSDLHQCYLHRQGTLYWERLAEHRILSVETSVHPTCVLAHDYQFLRELLFALHYDGCFVLLHDARSPIFVGAPQSVLPRLIKQLPLQLRSRVAAITVQQLVTAIHATGRHDDWIGAFEQKYGLA